jgi:radical SAM superfamily enzyme YgiQ (UPF0313 family)
MLAAERGAVVKEGAFPLEVALLYPNRYEVGSTNLGFQLVYRLLNAAPEVRCERVFWDPALLDPSGGGPVSLESGRPLRSFPMLAVSLSFEDDYVHLLRALMAGGIVPEAEARGSGDPVVVVGGPCAFLNPEPIAPFVDLFALGNGERLVPRLVERWLELNPRSASRRERFVESMAGVEGFYAPRFLDVTWRASGEVDAIAYRGEPGGRVVKVGGGGYGEGVPRLLSPFAHFADMPLVEIGSGCTRGCRFCAASFIYRPPRKRTLDEMRRDIDRLLPAGGGRIGLVGAALSDHPGLVAILEHIDRRGGTVGLSSMRLDGIDADVVGLLLRLGVRTLTCAPEAGSQRMRDVIRKSLTEEEILRAAEEIGRGGIGTLKLYFMIGLPHEAPEDVDAIADLVGKIRSRTGGGGTRVRLKINPFVPKPFTPFQWAQMDREAALREKMDRLKSRIAGIRGVSVKTGSIRRARIQGILARGDRRLATALLESSRTGISVPAALRRAGGDASFYLDRERPEDETFPWDFIDHGYSKRWLVREWRRAGKAASGGVQDGA